MSPDREFLEDIVIAAGLIGVYTEGLTRDSFERNIEKQDAIVRRLAVIGEAATKVPPSLREEFHEIPWGAIIGLRNVLVHQYWELERYRSS